MKAIIVKPPLKGAEIKDIDDAIGREGNLKIKIIESGICGTDREIVNGNLSTAANPPDSNFMVLGHEAIGILREDAEHLRKGDVVMPINRRGCGKCINCITGRPDFCETGEFREAGIKKMHGFMKEYIYDNEQSLVLVPKELRHHAILAQPLSDLEKSLSEVFSVQKRLMWTCIDGTYNCRKALVIGTGSIGTLASLLLKSSGFSVYVANRRTASDKESKIFDSTGIKYLNAGDDLELVKQKGFTFDLIIETSGTDAELLTKSIRVLKNNGIIGLFGFSSFGTASLDYKDIQKIVYGSLAIVGLINGQKPHFERALLRLAEWNSTWPDITKLLITRTININDHDLVISALRKKETGEIKVKISW
jgi:aldose 1-dehydrogenase [NAD(P)+]